MAPITAVSPSSATNHPKNAVHAPFRPDVTVISANGPLGADSAVTCDSGEGPGTVLEGFTITGGTGTTFPPPVHQQQQEGGPHLHGGGCGT